MSSCEIRVEIIFFHPILSYIIIIVNTYIDFDRENDRTACDATKYAELRDKYGRDDLLPMWIADMDFTVPAPVTRALVESMRQPVLGYTTAPASFWESIASWLKSRHGWNVSRADIDYVPGVKKGIGLCVNYFTRPGDRIVIQPPVYHSFRSVVEGNGRVAVENPLILDGGTYRIDFDGLEKAISDSQAKMMILCNPHNPIGIQWSREDLNRVVEICHRHNVIILSDEIYGDLVFRGTAHIPTASVSEKAAEITVTLGAPSKSFNIPGIASAWTVVVNPALRDGFFKWLHASEFDTPPIAAIYATRAAYTECEAWLDSVVDYIAANAVYARDYIAKEALELNVLLPDAGFGLWIDFNPTGLSHAELNDMLVNDARLAVSDGASFGKEGSGFIRLNIGVARGVLTEALERITAALKSRI